MRDVKAFDGEFHGIVILWRKCGAKHRHQIIEARGLSARFGQSSGKRYLRALYAHLKPAPACFLRFAHNGHAAAGKVREQGRKAARQLRVGGIRFDDQKGWNGKFGVVLTDKGFNDFTL